MQKTILITGGSGLVGQRLTEMALANHYHVKWLGRSIHNAPKNVESFVWNIEKEYIDEKCFENVDYVIHLSGAGVADKSWTPQRKKEILESRTKTTALLAKYLHQNKYAIQKIASASAIGFYGLDTGANWVDENSVGGVDFLAEVTQKWENETKNFTIPTSIIRIGVVLTEKGGALPKLSEPIKWGAGAGLGTGEQYISWIHIDDLCRIFLFTLENEQTKGIFNAVAPSPLTNIMLTKAIAKKMKKPLFLPNVPAFVLKMMLGEMANIVLGGNKVSAEKIIKEGFSFEYETIEKALLSFNI